MYSKIIRRKNLLGYTRVASPEFPPMPSHRNLIRNTQHTKCLYLDIKDSWTKAGPARDPLISLTTAETLPATRNKPRNNLRPHLSNPCTSTCSREIEYRPYRSVARTLCSSLTTVESYHCPPRIVGKPRLFNSSAIARTVRPCRW